MKRSMKKSPTSYSESSSSAIAGGLQTEPRLSGVKDTTEVVDGTDTKATRLTEDVKDTTVDNRTGSRPGAFLDHAVKDNGDLEAGPSFSGVKQMNDFEAGDKLTELRT
jgi:hypothetical protein